jgi:hypothetical protein
MGAQILNIENYHSRITEISDAINTPTWTTKNYAYITQSLYQSVPTTLIHAKPIFPSARAM